MAKRSTTKMFRLLHRYLGLFFAPAILFFSFSGAIQTFGWHENTRTSSYEPPVWIVRMAQLHKKQTLSLLAPKAKAQGISAKDASISPANKAAGNNTGKFVLKCFVFAMSVGLIFSTLFGIVMALLYGGDKRLVCVAVLAGVLLPVTIILLGT